MADARQPTAFPAWLAGLLGFAAFEAVAYFGLRWVLSGLGESNQYQVDNTIVNNWVKAVAFVVLHLALAIGALLVATSSVPRRYRGQVQGWFYVALLLSFILLIPLF